MGSKRLYQLESLPLSGDDDFQHLLRGLGVGIKMSGVIFRDKGTEYYVRLDGAGKAPLGIDLLPDTTSLSILLQESDNPMIYLEATGKPWLRKAQFQLSGQVQQRIWARDHYMCMVSGKLMGEVTLSVDHWIPLEREGQNNEHNYITMSRSWNKRKGDKTPFQFCNDIGLDYDGICDWIADRNAGRPGKLPAHLEAILND